MTCDSTYVRAALWIWAFNLAGAAMIALRFWSASYN